MADVSTRLRYIIADNPDSVVRAVGMMPFKVEIKGQPMQIKTGWILWFTITDNVEFESRDLRT